jgi:hypothetical protein
VCLPLGSSRALGLCLGRRDGVGSRGGRLCLETGRRQRVNPDSQAGECLPLDSLRGLGWRLGRCHGVWSGCSGDTKLRLRELHGVNTALERKSGGGRGVSHNLGVSLEANQEKTVQQKLYSTET